MASSSFALQDSERVHVIHALEMLAQSMRRAAKASKSDEIRALQERDAGRIDALAAKSR